MNLIAILFNFYEFEIYLGWCVQWCPPANSHKKVRILAKFCLVVLISGNLSNYKTNENIPSTILLSDTSRINRINTWFSRMVSVTCRSRVIIFDTCSREHKNENLDRYISSSFFFYKNTRGYIEEVVNIIVESVL